MARESRCGELAASWPGPRTIQRRRRSATRHQNATTRASPRH